MVVDICRCWDSNCRSFVLDATALPTEPQPLTNYGMDGLEVELRIEKVLFLPYKN